MSWENNWKQRAKRLAIGQKVRIKCCGQDNSRTIEHKLDCYITGCFRCHETSVEHKSPLAVLRSQEDLKKYKKKVQERKLELREDLDTTGSSWLLMANIGPELWAKYHIKQCTETGMVFMPIPIHKQYNGFLLRNVQGKGPKYISEVKQSFAALGTSDPVVIVEDYLSAIRVHEDTGVSTLCALGTSTQTAAKLHLAQHHQEVVLWLDSDKAGRDADKAWTMELRALGLKVKSVVTDDDPKLLSSEKIKKVLESVNVGT